MAPSLFVDILTNNRPQSSHFRNGTSCFERSQKSAAVKGRWFQRPNCHRQFLGLDAPEFCNVWIRNSKMVRQRVVLRLGVPNQNQTGKMMHEDFSRVDRDRCGNIKIRKFQQCTWPSALRQKLFTGSKPWLSRNNPGWRPWPSRNNLLLEIP